MNEVNVERVRKSLCVINCSYDDFFFYYLIKKNWDNKRLFVARQLE